MSTKILKCRGPLSVKGRLVRCILLFCSALFVLSAPLQGQQDSIIRAVEKVKKNVVTLTAAFPDGHEENGFGFVTGEKDGKLYLVTAGHVLHRGMKAVSIQGQVFNSLSLFPAKEVRWFESDDLSLLVMDTIPGYQWEKNCLGKSPQAYDKVRFIRKEKSLVSPGEGEIFSLEDPNRIEFTIATMAPGTSGAPLVGKSGIVGMVIEDANSSSTALALSRIRALIGNQNFPYFSASDFREGVRSDSNPDIATYNMLLVKGGEFTIGCASERESDCKENEKPAHKVTVSDFYIGKYEVTQKEWREIMGEDPSDLAFQGCDNCPVESISWDQIQQFLAKLNAKTGKIYRLPTEAEWEYAARGGGLSRGYIYAGSNVLDEVAWYRGNCNGKTHPVGGKKANELGLYDMSGNVLEWCQDWMGAYSLSTQTNYSGPITGSDRVSRGGSWDDESTHCRVTSRYGDGPRYSFNYIGFRLARTL